MLVAYFDNFKTANLDNLSYSTLYNTNPLTFNNNNIKEQLKRGGFSIFTSKNYEQNGIYLVSVREHSPLWSGKHKENSIHILYHIPLEVIFAARQRKIIIIIDNQSEGFSMNYENCDGFYEMHCAMKNLKLPPFSVIFVNGDYKFKNSYDQWLISNDEHRMFEHCFSLTHIFYFRNKPRYPLIQDAITNENVKDFNSLNRTARQHRMEHIIELCDRNIEKNALISGWYTNHLHSNKMPRSLYKEDTLLSFSKKINSYLSKPFVVDGDWTDMHGPTPDDKEETIFNHTIYKNSLLSVVTETVFHTSGAFITEKTLKPIVAGHPFMILGQYKFLEFLNILGYRTDFSGIDQNYDQIESPIERFKKFHDSLENFCRLPLNKKLDNIENSMPIILHNKQVFDSINYEDDFFIRLYKKTQECLTR